MAKNTNDTPDIEDTSGITPVQVDITNAPEALFSSDAPSQNETLIQFDESAYDDQLQESIRKFSETEVITRSLEDFQRYYARERRATCLDLLTKRVKVDWRKSDFVSRPSAWENRFVVGLRYSVQERITIPAWIACIGVSTNTLLTCSLSSLQVSAWVGSYPTLQVTWTGR
jgi:hypothetical protein